MRREKSEALRDVMRKEGKKEENRKINDWM